eukprot:COSAG02_NODE_2166_length_9611_cov_5.049201_3_plen_258_part_00
MEPLRGRDVAQVASRGSQLDHQLSACGCLGTCWVCTTLHVAFEQHCGRAVLTCVARAGRVCSGALADVPRQAIAEYRRSGDIAYAAYQLPTSTGQFIKTAVRLDYTPLSRSLLVLRRPQYPSAVWIALSEISSLQVVEAADLANYLADVARTGLEYLDGQYVDTAKKARQTNPSLPGVPPPQVGSRRTSQARPLSGAYDSSSSPAPFVAGLREAGAAVQSGKECQTDQHFLSNALRWCRARFESYGCDEFGRSGGSD